MARKLFLLLFALRSALSSQKESLIGDKSHWIGIPVTVGEALIFPLINRVMLGMTSPLFVPRFPHPENGDKNTSIKGFLVQSQGQGCRRCSPQLSATLPLCSRPTSPLPSPAPLLVSSRPLPSGSLTVLRVRGVRGVRGAGYQEGLPGVALLGLGVPEDLGVDCLRCPGLSRSLRGLLPRLPLPPR